MKAKKHLKWNTKCKLCLLPSLIGTAIFFVIPYIRVLYYSVIDNQFRRNFVWLDNYIGTLNNEYFLLALKNSLLLIVICVLVLIILALVISLALSYGIKWIRKTRFAFVLPMVIPTASVALIWRSVFAENTTVLPIYLLFIWKNIGICIVLLTAAFISIEKSFYEVLTQRVYRVYQHLVNDILFVLLLICIVVQYLDLLLLIILLEKYYLQ